MGDGERRERETLSESTGTILRVTNVRKTYTLGRVKVPVLHGVDLDVRAGEWIAVLGASGSGKSTLLHLMGGLDRPDRVKGGKGERASIVYMDREITTLGSHALDRYRARDVGFVFQFYHLLPELDVMSNVCVGGMIRHGRLGYRANKKSVQSRAMVLLRRFGLGDRLGHRPAELSGGERQRVAIARALINEPRVLLADEPTGNLDQKTGDSILDAIAEHRAGVGLTLVMVTHDERIAARADRVIRLVDGRVEEGAGV